MADPFSTASGAIGVISLGLQVTQQLITYCQAYRSYDEDAQRMESKAESLRRPLRALREIIEDAQVFNPELAADLSEKTLGLQRMVDRLKMAIDRYLPAIPEKFPGRIKGQLKKVVYPFRKDGLREMFEDLDGIQNALHTTLSIHSTLKMNKLGLMQEAILEEVQQIRVTLQEYPEGMPPPALLKSWCDSQFGYANKSVTETQITTRTSGSELAITTSSGFSDLAISPYKTKSNDKEEATAKSFRYLSSLLRVAVTASFSLSKGAGGFSIAPSLSVQTILKYNGSMLELQFRRHLNMGKRTTAGFNEVVDNCIRHLQHEFSAGKSKPSDIFYFDDGPREYSMTSYVDGLVVFATANTRNQLPGLIKLTKFLIDNGARPNNTFSQGALRGLLRFARFQEEEYALASYLVDHGGPCTLDDGTLNHIERYNVKYILARDKELIIVPEIVKIIFQESEQKLLSGLQSGLILPNDKFCGRSLLHIAFGWPGGMKILLDAGATIGGGTLISFWGCPSSVTEENIEFDGFYYSNKLLLERGCGLKVTDLYIAASPKLLSLFGNELAKRRWRLWKLAESCLPEDELPVLDAPETAVSDMNAARICAALTARDKIVDPPLMVKSSYVSVYHDMEFRFRVMEELLKVGFKNFDTPNEFGVTPLMEVYNSLNDGWQGVERMLWLLSKGADITRDLPLSNAKTAHLITVQIVGFLLGILGFRAPEDIPTWWARWENKVSSHRKELFPYPSIIDGCQCACCPHGCSIISVALRQVLGWDYWFRVSEPSYWLRRLLCFIIGWVDIGPIMSRSVIRSLTFDALGLKHTCCIEIDGVAWLSDRKTADEMEGREEDEIAEIREESVRGIEELEQLVLDLEAAFARLGLPLIEFLEGYWHTRMVEHLLKRDPYNEEHDREARNLGVILQVQDGEDLDRVSLLIGAQVKEIVE
ncbi:uncharacterized protein N7496_007012 [Penicillium cataractarum]|uniref:Fungal N-terminal domain-containing protein n=1 Tax=Penicillium cataractarum TaxID=2100454 RepID=A0A9W9S3Z5_9EURO|nr:uncharacterized protein N7496_007012 [Penicillium cataractarum]KAJ5370920.1 hypothetical protein N7496_007012 [Penicillium cataractarum]